jgi:hypothetical protein
MIILFGNRSFKKVLAHTGPFTCAGCGVAAYFQVLRVSKWFTLFFIPIFPYSVRYYHLCPTCGSSHNIKKSDAMEMVAQAGNV